MTKLAKPERTSPRATSLRDLRDYSARNSSKGALIGETARIFQAISRGASLDEVQEAVLHGTLLSQRSSENRRRIWTSITHRYLVENVPWLHVLMARLSQDEPDSVEFISILYLLYALRDRLTFDFVTGFLFPKATDITSSVTRNDVLDLLAEAVPQQPQIDRWSESTRVKLAGSVLTALRDFGLLAGTQKKTIVKPRLPLTTAEALVRILTSEGQRGRQVIEDKSWQLFLLREIEVAGVLSKLATIGVLRFEKVGSTVVLETPPEWESQP